MWIFQEFRFWYEKLSLLIGMKTAHSSNLITWRQRPQTHGWFWIERISRLLKKVENAKFPETFFKTIFLISKFCSCTVRFSLKMAKKLKWCLLKMFRMTGSISPWKQLKNFKFIFEEIIIFQSGTLFFGKSWNKILIH